MADVVELFGGPPAVDQTGNLTIWWVPAIANPAIPKLTEIAAGNRLTYSFLSDGWSFSVDTEKLKDDRLTAPQSRESIGRTTPTFSDLKYVDSDAATSAAVVLKGATAGFFVERRKVAQTALGAVADKVRVIAVTLGAQMPGPTDGAGKFSLVQAVAVQGNIAGEVAVAA